MIKISELQNEKGELVDEAKALLDAAEKGNRGMTAAETKRFDALERQIEALANRIDRETRQQQIEMERAMAMDSSFATPPPGWEERQMNGNTQGRAAGKPLYRAMFGAPTQSDFTNPEEFFRVVASGRHDPRLGKRTFTEGAPADGGFLVPDELAAMMLDTSMENEIVRPRATVWPMASATRKVPAWDNSDHTNLYGGLQGTWLGENSSASKVTGKMRQITLNAHKLAVYSSASNELVADGMGFEEQLQSAMTKSLGWSLDYAFLCGTGAGQPLGVLAGPSLITVTKETGQQADTILYENILKMWARLHPASAEKAIWVSNHTCIPALFGMGLILGTSAAPVFVPSAGVGFGTLLGRPIIFTEKVPTLGDKGDLLLVDFSQYFIGLRKEIYLDKSQAVGWLTDTSDYRAVLRADGMGSWAAPITPKTGSSLSWCIVIENRA